MAEKSDIYSKIVLAIVGIVIVFALIAIILNLQRPQQASVGEPFKLYEGDKIKTQPAGTCGISPKDIFTTTPWDPQCNMDFYLTLTRQVEAHDTIDFMAPCGSPCAIRTKDDYCSSTAVSDALYKECNRICNEKVSKQAPPECPLKTFSFSADMYVKPICSNAQKILPDGKVETYSVTTCGGTASCRCQSAVQTKISKGGQG